MLSDSLTLLGVPLVFGQWFNQRLCVSYFTDFISGSFGNPPVKQIKHYVLDILLRLLRDNYVMGQWIKVDIMC